MNKPIALTNICRVTTSSRANTPARHSLRTVISMLTRRISCSFVILGAALLFVQGAIADQGQWDFTGSLNTARASHSGTLLSNGMVLVAGGRDADDIASAELYDPASGSWTITDHLRTARNGHTATLLTNGMVLVAGGETAGAAITSADLYDPLSGN